MQRVATKAWLIGLLLAVLLIGAGFGLLGSTADRLSQTSAIAAPPSATPTYVSELAPAVMQPPRQPAELPSSGAGIGTAAPWPKAAGLGLALLGSLLIHAALTLRPHGTS